jgi:hypothetical protein
VTERHLELVWSADADDDDVVDDGEEAQWPPPAA